jgi:VCBS repeat-containing protein
LLVYQPQKESERVMAISTVKKNGLTTIFDDNNTVINFLGTNGQDDIFGNSKNNKIIAGNGQDRVFAGAGDDWVYGDGESVPDTSSNGKDEIYGGSGNDVVYAGNGADYIVGDGKDTVSGGNCYVITPTLTSILNNTGSTTISAASILSGAANYNNSAVKGNGDDVLIGGNGPDTFAYFRTTDSEYHNGGPGTFSGKGDTWGNSATEQWDFLADFESGKDKIDLSMVAKVHGAPDCEFKWWTPKSADFDPNLVGGMPAANEAMAARAWAVWQDTAGKFLYVDTNGDGAADMKIQVSNVGRGDFIGVDKNEGPDAEDDSNYGDKVKEEGIGTAGDPTAKGNVLSNDTDENGDDLKVVGGRAGDEYSSAIFASVVAVGPTVIVGKYGSLTLSQNGTWVYTLDNNDPDTQALKEGQIAKDVFTYKVTDGQGEYESEELTIKICGTNDGATVSSEMKSLTEGDTAAAISTSGQLVIADPDAGQALVVPQSVSGTYGTFAINASGAWTFTANGPHDELTAGQVVTDTFTVASQDGTGSGTVVITITGTNDGATVTSDAKSVTEGNLASDLDASGTVVITDPDTGEAHSVVQNATAGTYGDFSVDADGNWSYVGNGAHNELTAGQVVTDTFTVASQDGTGSGTVVITINGTNDAPVISVLGTDSTFATLAETNAGLNAAGTLSLTDADLSDTVTSTVTGLSAAGVTAGAPANLLSMLSIAPAGAIDADAGTTQNLSWIFNSGGQAFNYLGAGQSLVLTYTITSTDTNGASDTQDVVVTINGTNDVAVISAAPGQDTSVREAGGVNNTLDPNPTASGVLVVADADAGQSQFQAPASLAGLYGTFQFNPATGAWSYQLNNLNEDIQDMDLATVPFIDTLTVTSLDGSTPYIISVTINGQNDAPVLVLGSTPTIAEGASYMLTAADLGFTDVDDLADSIEFTLSAPTNGSFLLNGLPVAVGSLPLVVSGTQVAAGAVHFVHNGSETLTAGFNVSVDDDNTDLTTPTASPFTFNVTPINDAPVITSNGGGASAAISIPENTTAVTTVAATDPDSSPLSYSIVGGADQAKFAIHPTTGVLTFIAAPDFENPTDVGPNNVYEVVVQVSDGVGGLVDTQTLAVTVTNVPENVAPTANADSQSINDATATQGVAIAGTASVLLNDVDDGALNVTGIKIAGGGAFAGPGSVAGTYGTLTIAANGTYTYTPNAALDALTAGNNPTDVFTYQITDAGGLTSTANLTFNITGADDAAIDLVFTNPNIPGNSLPVGANANFGSIVATDPDGGAAAATFQVTSFSEVNRLTGLVIVDPTADITISSGGVFTNAGMEDNRVYEMSVQVTQGTSTFTEVFSVVTGGSAADNITGAWNLGDDIIIAQGAGDTIVAGDGNDSIFGQQGDDMITGGAGRDIIRGDGGADVFFYSNIADAGDLIVDYEAADRIDLSALLVGETAATIGQFVQYSTVTGVLSVDFNGNVGGANFVSLVTVDTSPAAGVQAANPVTILYDGSAIAGDPSPF